MNGVGFDRAAPELASRRHGEPVVLFLILFEPISMRLAVQFNSTRIRLLVVMFVFSVALGVPAAIAAETFSLQAARTHRVFGPYALSDGDQISLDGHAYQIRIVPPDRLSFISLSSGRVYGPVQTIDGRLLEINDQMYAFYWRVEAIGATPRAPLPPMPQAPPRPESIPIPPVKLAVPPKPRTLLPAPSTAWRTALWYAPVHETPMKWKVDDLRGKDTDITRTTLGGSMEWRGWSAQLGLSPSVSGGEILPRGLDVTESELEDGTGWSLALGYKRPFLKEGRWEATGGARLFISQDKMDLTSTTALGQLGTNDTVDVTYATETTSITVTEMALWLDLGLSYSEKYWGFYLDLGLIPFGSVEVSGDLMYGDEALSLSAERGQPMTFGVGGWVGVAPWRGFVDYTAGSETRLRFGAMIDF